MEPCRIRNAEPTEQRELTRLVVRATLHAGYDEAFIERAMPALTVTLPLITVGAVQVAEQESGEIAGVVSVTPTALQGIGLLNGLFVDPPMWRRGVGRALFAAAAAAARKSNAGALMIYAAPSAEGFYVRQGAVQIGAGPFYFSPDVVLPRLLYIVPRES
jgi:N-acetylglutamate synthase-like GNAT family acetyltransferase